MSAGTTERSIGRPPPLALDSFTPCSHLSTSFTNVKFSHQYNLIDAVAFAPYSTHSLHVSLPPLHLRQQPTPSLATTTPSPPRLSASNTTSQLRRLSLSSTPRVSVVTDAGDLRGLARLHAGKAKYASRWKTVQPTETAYQLADEYYRYAARRDLGLPHTQDIVLPQRCGACGLAVAADGLHGQRCIYRGRLTTLRHNSIEKVLHDTVRDGIGHAHRQERNLPAADRTVPNLVIHLEGQIFLCDVTVVAARRSAVCAAVLHVYAGGATEGKRRDGCDSVWVLRRC